MHIDEFVLNEYLDGMLEAAEETAVRHHLASCPDCRARLTELQNLFSTLEEVAEMPLQIDLSQRIMAEIEPTSAIPLWSKWVMGVQLVTAVILTFSFWPMLQTYFTQATLFAENRWRLPDWPQLILTRLTEWQTAVSQQLQPTTPLFNIPTEQWLWLIGFAFIAWLISSRWLLKPINQPQQIA